MPFTYLYDVAVHNISKDLVPLAYPIEKLRLLPGNPRMGNVESVMASLRKFGQRKTISARLIPDGEDGVGEVLAGNTTLKAAKRLGWTEIAVAWEDDDDQMAAAWALADNKTHDDGEYDEENLAAMIQRIEDNDELLEASGFDLMDLEDIMANLAGEELPGLSEDEDGTIQGDPEEPKRAPQPVIQYALIFEDEDQKSRWFSFVRWLKLEYPDADTLAGRLDEFLSSLDGLD